ncbi:MAG: hypothetical protein HWN69_00935 [Desulfobacterales bacterium]|nr:hypothetical protein [Desulfobacterales bacterium]
MKFLLNKPKTTIHVEDLKRISEYFELIKQVKDSYSNLYRSFRSFEDLKTIPDMSDLKVLGYFSIIEALITHAPKLAEPMDSLNHQLRTKVPLLRKRFEREISYQDYFERAKEENIWTKLYQFRSCIAHGAEPNFSKDLNVLRTCNDISLFLQELTKLLLIYTLKDPGFVSDLKKC